MVDKMEQVREAFAALSPWQREAIRGRIILGFLTRNGVDVVTLNDKPFAVLITAGLLKEGVSGLLSAGPEYDLPEGWR